MTETGKYKDTVNLPKTNFDMRANAIKREPEIQKFWEENNIYSQLAQNNPGELFILHDGPPYANGQLHIGHALNKILKDIINRYHLLQGRKIRYVPGWDCHGLPIELKVLQNMKQAERQNLTPLQLRQKAKEFALKTVDEQRESFKRYGIWGDWENPYLTLKPEYEAAQIGVFGEMFLKGYIYRGLKPVHWSPSSKTALAEAELEYPEGHVSRSIYAAFPVVKVTEGLKASLDGFLPDLGVAVWTTTPWTIPGNLAVAVNADLNYAVVSTRQEFTKQDVENRAREIWETKGRPQQDKLGQDADYMQALLELEHGLTKQDVENRAREIWEAKGRPQQDKLGQDADYMQALLELERGFTKEDVERRAREIWEAKGKPQQDKLGQDADYMQALRQLATRGKRKQLPKYLIIAADLVDGLATKLNVELVVKAKFAGKDLEHTTYRHPLFDRESPVVVGGDYITTESGTGLVHTAPGHGQEDYIVGQRYGLPILAPVDDSGNFTDEAGKFSGLNVLGEGNQAIIDALQEAGSLLKEEAYPHKYPYDWRTKKPTIFRATEQWFASVAGFREEALTAISSVRWIPAQGENRITPMIAERSDWCISRQRSWGVPIPVFYDEATGEVLLNADTINHVQAIFAEKGSDAWWELSVAELLPEQYRNNGKTYRRGTDTMDVWFDSGSSWAAVAKQRPELCYPVDMYLEGSDQHRGWFQSSLLTSVAVNGIAPYKTVLTHGFVLDENGRKMSKSVGNVVDPQLMIQGGTNQKQQPAYGADVLRLWVSSVDYSGDVRLGNNIIKQLADVRNKIRNTARFLLGSLHDFDPLKDAVAFDDLPDLDKYMLHRIREVFNEVTEAFDSFQFFRFFQTVQNFCVVDLSNFYLDVAKDRLYISSADAFRRRSCQTVLQIALENLAIAIAPVLCHTAEDIWQFIPYETSSKSVFQAGWVQVDDKWENAELAEFWKTLRRIRGDVNKVLEQARTEKLIGSSLEAIALIYLSDEKLRAAIEPLNVRGNGIDELRYLFLTSEVQLLDSPETLKGLKTLRVQGEDNWDIGVVNAADYEHDGKSYQKCDRCWNYSTHVGESAEHPLLCERCIPALAGEF